MAAGAPSSLGCGAAITVSRGSGRPGGLGCWRGRFRVPAPALLVEESVRRVVPGARDVLPRARVVEEAKAAAAAGRPVLIASVDAWLLWRVAAREAWMSGDNYHVLEAAAPWEAELAGVGYGQLVVARAAYAGRRRSDAVEYERLGLGKRVTRRALLRGGPASVLAAVERPREGDLCATRGVDRACLYCRDACGGNVACAAALLSTELLVVAGYSREGLHDYLRVLGLRGPGYMVFASRWSLERLRVDLAGSAAARTVIVPVSCPYTVGLEELLAARALGFTPLLVYSEENSLDPSCRDSREPYSRTVARDYEALTGEELEILPPGDAASRLREAAPGPEPVKDAAALLTRGLHSLALAELDRLTSGDGGKPLGTLLTANIVVDSRCTLCSACVQECPTDALTLRRSEEREELLLLPGRCIACGYCVEVCPEDAMALVHEAPREPGKWRTIYSEEAVRCAACGRPVAPKSMVVAVARRIVSAGLNEKILVTLVLCDACRQRYQLGALKLDEERIIREVKRLAGIEED